MTISRVFGIQSRQHPTHPKLDGVTSTYGFASRTVLVLGYFQGNQVAFVILRCSITQLFVTIQPDVGGPLRLGSIAPTSEGPSATSTAEARSANPTARAPSTDPLAEANDGQDSVPQAAELQPAELCITAGVYLSLLF